MGAPYLAMGWRLAKAMLLASMAAAVPLAWVNRGRPGLAVVCLAALVLAAGFPWLSARVGLRLSGALEVVWMLPLASCWGFGEGLGLFARLGWWDRLTHGLGGATVVALFVGLAAARARGLPRGVLLALALAVALACGALWELGEFASDSLFGTVTQAGNADTMLDLAFDLAGAAAAVLAVALASWSRARSTARLLAPLVRAS